MQIIDAHAVNQVLTFEALIPAINKTFQQAFGMPQRQMYPLPGGTAEKHDTFAVLPAWTEDVLGVKSFTHYPENPQKGLLTVAAQVLLFSRSTGAPLALVDGTSLTYWRTAAVSALAASYMAREDASTLLLFGTGELAPFMAIAHASVRPIHTVYVHGRSDEKMRSVQQKIKAIRPDLNVQVCHHYESVITGIDIVSCATGSPTPLFNSALLAAGTHLDLVGNHHRTCRECDSATVKMSRVIVDSRLNVLNEAGEILIPLAENCIEESHIQGELAELCSSTIKGRLNNSETTLFKSVGTALADVASAYLVYQLLNSQT
ncbi:bifunctional Delta(1)-pyrroline-2-carboxylate/Delta(1)-piperideine-2-carboxylate reductase [Marinomonas shanghaiensis]|jgi:1-pyrroline-2-carboxylate reductase [NAD(P)H]|uniref:ornithine cyclodeaminase family protein n=1 Tax=Marinomonas shanghaiensis TaxID=2202418 RepID=UPI000DBA7C36|nr:ornithine cyclodeaminase family protein [Marinomonas shanghaiensis]